MQIKYALALAMVFAVILAWFPLFSFGEEAQLSSSAKQQALHQSAEQGDAKAQYDLGSNYENGWGETQDYREALRWYQKAAEQGFTEARFALARMYFEGTGVKQDFAEAARWYGCPKASEDILKGCKGISYDDLPGPARDLLESMKCDLSYPYNYGSTLDLNDDGTPEYQICCSHATHGPCSAVVIGQVGSEWKDLSAGPNMGFTLPCAQFVVLANKIEGFHDICLPAICSPLSPKTCVPTIWRFKKDRYRIIKMP
jgi:hypothetical protein